MVYTAIEWIALVFVLVGIVKLSVLAVSKMSWLNFSMKVFGNKGLTTFVFLILSIIVFYYLILEMTIVQLMAAWTFMSLLMGVAFMQYDKEFFAFAKKIYSKKFPVWIWIYSLVWVGLMVWTLWEILG